MGFVLRKKFFCLLFFFSPTIYSATVKSSQYNYGLGLGVGRPSGISGYVNLNAESFIQGMLAFSSFGIVATGDYTFRIMNLVKKHPQLVPYVGIGGLLYFFKADVAPIAKNDDPFTAFGIRVPIGLYYQIKEAPLQIGLEAVPTAIISPGTWIFLDLTIYGRYMF